MLGLVFSLLCLPDSTSAQQDTDVARDRPDATTVAAARALAVQGVKLARAGQCAEAIDKLERAEQLHHAAVVAAQLGDCYVQVGRLVEGSEMFRAVLREPEPAGASESVHAAYAQASRGLAFTKPLIGALVLRVNGPAPDVVSVTVDGKAVPAALLGAPRLTDPGECVVQAQAPGFASAEQRVRLEPGQTREVVLTLANVAPAEVVVPVVAAAPKVSEAAKEERSSSTGQELSAPGGANVTPIDQDHGRNKRIAAYVMWGVGGVALAAGGAFGYLALDGKKQLDDACVGSACPTSERGRLDDTKLFGNISTAAFVLGGAAIITGTVLYVVGRKRHSDELASAPHRGPHFDFRRGPLFVRF